MAFTNVAVVKLVVQFSRWFFRTYGPRYATPEERAAYNFIRNLPAGMIMDKRLEVKAKKEIGKSAMWLDKSDDNLLSPHYIWERLRLGLLLTEDLNSRLLVLRGDDPTVLIVRGCANAMFIFRLLDLYSAGAVGIRGTIERLELADAGLFDLAVLARACGSWHVGIEQLAVLSLDLELKERVQVFGDKQARENTGIDRYFGGRPYPIGRDIALVELSCSKEVTEKLKNCPSRSLGNVSFYWKTSNTSRRVPVALEFGSTASAFPENSPATFDAVFGYTTEIMTRA